MDFQSEVLDRSVNTPVLVDFWAEWCGPCRVLTPVLEQIEAESNYDFKLVKINTEEEPNIALEHSIRSIPNVKLFIKGNEVASFAGAMSKTAVENWLETHLQNPQRNKLESILISETDTDAKHFYDQLDDFLKEFPDDFEAKVHLQRAAFATGSKIDTEFLKSITMDNPYYLLSQNLILLDSFIKMGKLPDRFSHSDIEKAQQALRENDLETFISNLVKTLLANPGYGNEYGRKLGVAFFCALNPGHILVKKFRKLFDMALY